MEKKMKRKPNKVPKDRNPFVSAAMFRVAGAHVKSNKAKRRQMRVELQRTGS